MALNEDDARRLLLVRAIETEDTDESLLTREDRRHATGAALAQAPEGDGRSKAAAARRADDAFLARRSAFAYDRLAGRYPVVAKACRSAHWPGWINWLLPLAALVFGFFTNEIDSDRRLSIIALPMAAMLLWNLVVYALLLAGFARRAMGGRADAKPNPLARLLQRAVLHARSFAEAQRPLGSALGRFLEDWLHYSSRLSYSRASRTLHFSAALLAAGVLLGMYWRALSFEYRAGWESTLLDPAAVHSLVSVILAPASAITGISLPDLSRVEALRWGPGSVGENAEPWIHLFAATAALFIIVPRLLLAGWHALRAAALRRRFPIPSAEDFYVRRLLRSAQGTGSLVRVVPYSFHPPEPAQQRLRALLTDLLGEKTRVTVETPIAYGEEDQWLASGALSKAEADHVILLLNLSSTPEAENHGALAVGIQRGLASSRGGTALAILLDESAYRQRLVGQSGSEGRLASRRAAWREMLGAQGLEPLTVDLAAGDTPELARELERALLRTGGGAR